MESKISCFRLIQGRLSTHVGYEVKGGKNPINIYGKVSVIKEFDGEVEYGLNGTNLKTDYGDAWVVYRIAATVKMGKLHDVYLDIERAEGSRLKQPWAISGGYRYNG